MTDDYIRRQDAVDVFNRAVQDVGILDADDIETVFGMLSPADVAPVVRCKDCKYLGITTLGSYWCQNVNGCAKPTSDSFCSYGEGKEKHEID